MTRSASGDGGARGGAPDAAGTGSRTGGAGARHRRRETSAGGVVVWRGGGRDRYLVIRDPYGHWGLPKGHVEGEESALEAARREIAEETGLLVDEPFSALPTIDWYFQDGEVQVHKYCHFFLFVAPTEQVTPAVDEGISACEWLTMDQALERITYDNARGVLREAGLRLSPRPDASP